MTSREISLGSVAVAGLGLDALARDRVRWESALADELALRVVGHDEREVGGVVARGGDDGRDRRWAEAVLVAARDVLGAGGAGLVNDLGARAHDAARVD